MLRSDSPCMIARYGAYELLTVLNYLGVKNNNPNYLKYIKGEIPQWWWNKRLMNRMQTNTGFFPATESQLSKYSERIIDDSKDLDLLAVYSTTKDIIPLFEKYIPDSVGYIPSSSLDSFLADSPWTRALEGKNVLVIYPYAELIEKQYIKREKLFDRPNIIPKFNLRTVNAVQSLGGASCGFKDWFAALEWMMKEMDKEPYDIALIGCGAYGFSLAAHAKQTGHKAIHIGGSLQLLFGIKGKRWENPLYGTQFGIPEGTYPKLMDNPAWVRPEEYRTVHTDKVENGCYW